MAEQPLFEPRPYQDDTDLEAMQALLVAGRAANTPTYYVHVGDLDWWLHYGGLADHDRGDILYLWEGGPDGLLAGWALLSPGYAALDVYPHPALLGTPQAAAMWAWAERRLRERLAPQGIERIQTLWVAEGDAWTVRVLTGLGFQRAEYALQAFRRSLSDLPPAPELPEGFSARLLRGELDAEARARASHAAFQSGLPWDEYMANMRRFMRSPAYRRALDLAILAPGGAVAAFCICWTDSLNRVGLFEPVGVHPDFQRRGLGRALMIRGLWQLAARGMQHAIVGAETDNPAALALYRSAGFEPLFLLLNYLKALG